MPVDTSLPPYFDDFDGKRNYVSVLYKASFPVQARELNTMQSIQDNQRKLFADHVFKDGACVFGPAPRKSAYHYITLKQTSSYDNQAPKVALIPGGVSIQGEQSLVKAQVIRADYIDGIYVLYVRYTGASVQDNENAEFLAGETISIPLQGMSDYKVEVAEDDTYPDVPRCGRGTIWEIPASVYYINGNFLNVEYSVVVAEPFTEDETEYTLGFDVIEQIVSAVEDDTLYDNALGYPNYSAPGADRKQISLVPVTRGKEEKESDNFIVLARVEEGNVVYIKSRTDYARLMDTLAERTYDESGNYTVRPFNMRLFEHLKKYDGDQKGYYTKDRGGREDQMLAILGTGKAYVKGYLVERISETKLALEKARDVKKERRVEKRFDECSYILVTLNENSAHKPIRTNSKPDSDEGDYATLYDGGYENGTPQGDAIGRLKVFDTLLDSVRDGKNVYRLYIADIELDSGYAFSHVKTIHHYGECIFSATPYESADISSVFTISQNNPYLMYIGKDNIKSIRDVDDATVPSLSVTVRKTFYDTIESNGKVRFEAASGESLETFNPNTTIAGIMSGTAGGGAVTMLPSNKITVDGNTIELNCGQEYAGLKAFCVHNVGVKDISQNTKTLTQFEERGVPYDPQLRRITLANKDVLRINRITAQSSGGDATDLVDVTDMFTLHNNARDFAYSNSYLTANTSIDNIERLAFDIDYEYLAHGAGEIFTIDSYAGPIGNQEVDFTYADLPTVVVDGIERRISDYLDFRASKKYIPAIGGKAMCDVTYYLPRIDYIVVNKDGEIYQKKGISADKPRPPQLTDGDEMSLYSLYLSPYGFDCYKDCKVTYLENKRYTMRDIGRIEKRVSQLEYTTTLNLLEQELQTMDVKDQNGLDRFKNGYVADNFRTLAAADYNSGEFRATLFSDSEELKPRRTKTFCKMGVNIAKSAAEGPVVQKTNALLIDYDEEIYISQPYASKWISVNPYYIYSVEGLITLTPDSDTWTNTEDVEEEVVSTSFVDVIDSYSSSSSSSSSSGGVVNQTVRRGENLASRGGLSGTWTSTESTSSQTVTTTSTSVSTSRTLLRTESEKELVDTWLTDASLTPYMRSTDVYFHATGLRPNLKVYMFFDGKPVTEFCKVGFGPDAIEDSSEFVTNADGELDGVFTIPEETFFAGQKTFRITNHPEDSRDRDMLLTEAEGIYWSQGMNVKRKENYHETITRHWNLHTHTHTSTNTFTLNTTTITSWLTQNNFSGGDGGGDPLAQSFTVDRSCFISSVAVYFKEVVEDDRMFCMILGTENGYPSWSKQLGVKYFTHADCEVSEDASKETRINFDFPIYLEGGKEYALVVGGQTPYSFMWVSRLGEKDVVTGNTISTQPSLGSLFKSQNGTTWTAEQYEDLKFELYRCKFKSNTLTAVFENQDDESLQTALNPFETENGSRYVRVHSRNHGMVAGDLTCFRKSTQDFTKNGFTTKNTPLRVKVKKGKLPTGKWLEDVVDEQGKAIYAGWMVSDSGSGYIVSHEEEKDNNGNPTGFHIVYLRDVRGKFKKGEPFSVESRLTNQYNLLIVKSGYKNVQLRHEQYEGCQGEIANDWETGVYNGIPVEELTDSDLRVYTVDSVDSYIVQVKSTANGNGLTGGIVELNENKRFDSFIVDGIFDKNEFDVSWNTHLWGHSVNGLFEDKNYLALPMVETELGDINFLEQPAKLANEINESEHPDGAYDTSITLTGKFTISDPNLEGWVSPVVYTDTFQFEGFANWIEYLEGNPDEIRHDPNNVSEFVEETHPSDGVEVFKYITKPIILENPASDLKVLVDVKQEQHSDFDIYVRFLHPWEYNDIREKEWVKIEQTWKEFSGPEYREVSVQMSMNNPDYLQDREFEQFQVKLVGRSKNTSKPITFKRFRAIAVT